MFLTAEQFAAQKDLPMTWVIPGLLPSGGWGMITAAPKAGKTFLALQIAREVSAGGRFLGEPCTARPVLYLQRDMKLFSWRYRLQEMIAAGVKFPSNLLMLDDAAWPKAGLDLLSQGALMWLKAVVDKADPDLVILDTLRSFHSGDENKSDVAARLCDALSVLAQHRALLLVHHDNKFAAHPEAGEYTPIQAARGSSALPGYMDLMIGVSRKQLRIVTRHGDDRTIPAGRTDEGLWDLARDPRDAQVLELCAAYPDKGHKEIAQLAASQKIMGYATFFRHAKRLNCVHVSPS